MFGASSELTPNMFGTSSELAPNTLGASSEPASVMEFGFYRTYLCGAKVQAVVCGRMAVFLRVRVPSDTPQTVFEPKFRYVNGRHGNDHVTPVENNEVVARA